MPKELTITVNVKFDDKHELHPSEQQAIYQAAMRAIEIETRCLVKPHMIKQFSGAYFGPQDEIGG